VQIIYCRETSANFIMAGLDSLILIIILSLFFWLGAQLNAPPKKKEPKLEEKFVDSFRQIIAEAIETGIKAANGETKSDDKG
jgi:hypothetical protein